MSSLDFACGLASGCNHCDNRPTCQDTAQTIFHNLSVLGVLAA
jgi:hypothetical protein